MFNLLHNVCGNFLCSMHVGMGHIWVNSVSDCVTEREESVFMTQGVYVFNIYGCVWVHVVCRWECSLARHMAWS